MDEITLYEAVGGAETFRRLVEAFYARVENDAILRPLFPADLAPGKQVQFMFISQYFGGPSQYTQERGHPRLRMRHAPFPIDTRARDAWVNRMFEAIDEVGIPEPYCNTMREYFERSATFMINQDK
jgi:hemoglobin